MCFFVVTLSPFLSKFTRNPQECDECHGEERSKQAGNGPKETRHKFSDGHRNHGIFFNMIFPFLSTAAGGGERESECFTTQGWMLETSLVFRDGFCNRDREKLLRISIFATSSLMVHSKREELQ